ncbi:MAG: hypothetical protein ACJAWS_002710 [Oleiphilaceae bacterium]|jgi:hypothetical protein
MGSNMSDQNKHTIATFAALKTSIANGEAQSIKLLEDMPIKE